MSHRDFGDYRPVVYRNYPEGWVAEIPEIAGCYALMTTPKEALAELAEVFLMIEEERRAEGGQEPMKQQ